MNPDDTVPADSVSSPALRTALALTAAIADTVAVAKARSILTETTETDSRGLAAEEAVRALEVAVVSEVAPARD